LPYIATADLSILDVARFEPHVALDGGADGLMLIRRLLEAAPRRLARPGLLLIEHGADQGAAALELAQRAFPDALVTLLKDDAGLDRAVRLELSNLSYGSAFKPGVAEIVKSDTGRTEA
jgi:release factor glutamine methyltransferase